jgi:hypothetical protein
VNPLRRTLLVVYSLLLLAACAGLAVLAWNEDQQLDLDIGDFNLVAFIAADDAEKVALTAVLGVVALFSVLSVLVAVAGDTPGRRRGNLRIRQSDGGTVEVTAVALEGIIRAELEALPDVRQATPRVRVDGGAVDSEVDVAIEPSANIAHVTSAVAGATARALREQVGVAEVHRPNIRITYDELAARPIGVVPRAKPQAPAPRGADEPPFESHDRPPGEDA